MIDPSQLLGELRRCRVLAEARLIEDNEMRLVLEQARDALDILDHLRDSEDVMEPLRMLRQRVRDQERVLVAINLLGRAVSESAELKRTRDRAEENA